MGSYQEYTYLPGAAREGVRKLEEAQGTVSLEAYRCFRSELHRIAAKRNANEKLTAVEEAFWGNSYGGELQRIAAKRNANEKLTAVEEAFWGNSYGGELHRIAAKMDANEKLTDDEEQGGILGQLVWW